MFLIYYIFNNYIFIYLLFITIITLSFEYKIYDKILPIKIIGFIIFILIRQSFFALII